MRSDIRSTLVGSFASFVLFVGVSPESVAGGSCASQWGGGFGQRPGLQPFIGNPSAVFGMGVFDDGNGPCLYVGGMFEKAGGVRSPNIARFDGETWTAVGPGANTSVRDFAVFDDGSGPALYVAGEFQSIGGVLANGIAKFDGTTWSALPAGGGFAQTLAVYDDGSGSALYVGGGGSVKKWNGTTWSTLPSLGSGALVEDLAVFDWGAGPHLAIGGFFTLTNPIGVYFWNGTSYAHSLLANARVETLHVGSGLGGNALYLGGLFTQVDFVPVSRVARWNGSSIQALGSGADQTVESLALFDDGTGVALYAGGSFTSIGGVAASGFARWNGTAWSGVAGITPPLSVNVLTTFDSGNGSRLFLGGNFDSAANGASLFDCAWLDGNSLRPLGKGLDGEVAAVESFDDGTGEALYIGGSFRSANGVLLNRIAKQSGNGWVSLAGGMAGGNGTSVRALEVHDFGSGPDLYAAGEFTSAGGVAANRVASWDGAAWSPLGGGVDGSAHALLSFDDGSGPVLCVGGAFQGAGTPGITARLVAKWNGTTWSGFGQGLTADSGTPAVYDLAAYDDGAGVRLYASGSFTKYLQFNVNRVARWTGSSWAGLGNGFTVGSAYAMQVFDEGSGPALFVAGDFGILSGFVQRWKNNTWSSVGGGFGPDAGVKVRALHVHDDGNGPALYAGGKFGTAGGTPVRHVARWNGTAWSGVGGGVGTPYSFFGLDFNVLAFASSTADPSVGSALIAVGDFTEQADFPQSHVARFACEPTPVFTNVLGATGGAFGTPQLALGGSLAPASALAFDLTSAPPAANAVLFVSAGTSPVPFLGGTLHAFPVAALLALPTDSNGEIHLVGPFPGAPSGTVFGFQVAIQDASVPLHGAVLSNGVIGVVP